ncbi:uncharacterized protein BP5553_01732 [Venustampulla echinocandica]|uniref:Uncharacterized protein n=1 Tax=Venustampulla echinocandica TaxID=2656787 RepID=A0A370U1Y2_9HELO|nr:uncharacterized protein BP5553_01732 [Venustampulla echinocandica]RDL41753.1 hypothetical protein BP5553_01732 [Venustampulla echinocandica]
MGKIAGGLAPSSPIGVGSVGRRVNLIWSNCNCTSPDSYPVLGRLSDPAPVVRTRLSAEDVDVDVDAWGSGVEWYAASRPLWQHDAIHIVDFVSTLSVQSPPPSTVPTRTRNNTGIARRYGPLTGVSVLAKLANTGYHAQSGQAASQLTQGGPGHETLQAHHESKRCGSKGRFWRRDTGRVTRRRYWSTAVFRRNFPGPFQPLPASGHAGTARSGLTNSQGGARRGARRGWRAEPKHWHEVQVSGKRADRHAGWQTLLRPVPLRRPRTPTSLILLSVACGAH